MALGNERAIVSKLSGLDEGTVTKLRNLKTNGSIGFAWVVEPATAQVLAPLENKATIFTALLMAHRNGTKGADGKIVNLSDKEQIALSEAVSQINAERSAIIGKAMNTEGTNIRAGLKVLENKLPGVAFKLSVKTGLVDVERGFVITALHKGNVVESAEAMLADKLVAFLPKVPTTENKPA